MIHEFNQVGLTVTGCWGECPHRITGEQRQRVFAVAGARPDTHVVPLTRWPLDRLSAYLAQDGLAIPSMHLCRRLDQPRLAEAELPQLAGDPRGRVLVIGKAPAPARIAAQAHDPHGS